MDNKKASNTKFLVAGLVVVVVVLVGLIAFGYLAVRWKQPQQQVVLVTRVCGDDIVTRFNKIDSNNYPKLVSDIKSKPHYQSDPTCQAVLLTEAIYQGDYKSAKQAYTALKTLNSQHVYVDNSLNTGQSLSSFADSVQSLLSSNTSNDAQEQQ